MHLLIPILLSLSVLITMINAMGLGHVANDDMYLFSGLVEILKIDEGMWTTERDAELNEVVSDCIAFVYHQNIVKIPILSNKKMLEVFCGRTKLISDLFTDQHGIFEEYISVEIMEKITKCNSTTYIGFFKQKSPISKELHYFVQDKLTAKNAIVRKLYAKVNKSNPLKFSAKTYDKDGRLIRQYKDEVNPNINLQEDKDRNSFAVCFGEKIVYINTQRVGIEKENYFFEQRFLSSDAYLQGQNDAKFDGHTSASSSFSSRTPSNGGKQTNCFGQLCGAKKKSTNPRNFADDMSD